MKKRFFPVLPLLLLLSLPACPSRTAAQLPDRTNVTDFGAVPNGGDDTDAIDAAINAPTPTPTPGSTPSRSIYFPPGTYNYKGRMALQPHTSYRFYGEGPGVSTIIFSGSDAGIDASDMGQNTLNVEGLTLAANSTNCGTAIFASFDESAGKFRAATIHNVQIIGEPRAGGGWWTNGISLYRAQNSVIDKVEITGAMSADDPYGTEVGILWKSSDTYKATGLQVTNLQIKYAKTGLQTRGWVEDLYLSEFEIAFCGKYGWPVVDLYWSDPASRKAAFHLTNGHIQCFEQGIRLENLRDVNIAKVNFAHNTTPTFTDDGTILGINNCLDVGVSGCTFYGVNENGGTNFEYGIFVIDSQSVRIAQNFFWNMLPGKGGDCIAVTQTTNNATMVVRIVDNLFYQVRNPIYNGVPAQTYLHGNHP